MKQKELNQYLVNLNVALKRLGQTRSWLSDQCNLSHSAIGNLFRRNSYPSLNVAIDIAKVTGYPIEQMVGGDVESFQPANKTMRAVMESKIIQSTKSLREDELDSVLNIVKSIVDFRRMP